MKKHILLLLVMITSFASHAWAVTIMIDFEDLYGHDTGSGVLVGDTYSGLGVHFQNVVALTAGYSLNEIDYPPHSGYMAVGAFDNAPVTVTFDALVSDISVFFAYDTQLTLTAFDGIGNVIGSYTHSQTSNLGTNELIGLVFTGVKTLEITGGDPLAYVFDDFSFTGGSNSVPEPSTIVLLGAGLMGLAGYRNYKRREKNA